MKGKKRREPKENCDKQGERKQKEIKQKRRQRATAHLNVLFPAALLHLVEGLGHVHEQASGRHVCARGTCNEEAKKHTNAPAQQTNKVSLSLSPFLKRHGKLTILCVRIVEGALEEVHQQAEAVLAELGVLTLQAGEKSREKRETT